MTRNMFYASSVMGVLFVVCLVASHADADYVLAELSLERQSILAGGEDCDDCKTATQQCFTVPGCDSPGGADCDLLAGDTCCDEGSSDMTCQGPPTFWGTPCSYVAAYSPCKYKRMVLYNNTCPGYSAGPPEVDGICPVAGPALDDCTSVFHYPPSRTWLYRCIN